MRIFYAKGGFLCELNLWFSLLNNDEIVKKGKIKK